MPYVEPAKEPWQYRYELYEAERRLRDLSEGANRRADRDKAKIAELEAALAHRDAWNPIKTAPTEEFVRQISEYRTSKEWTLCGHRDGKLFEEPMNLEAFDEKDLLAAYKEATRWLDDLIMRARTIINGGKEA